MGKVQSTIAVLLGVAVLSASLGGAAQEKAPRLDLNRATAQELETLPQVGPALAQRIVEFRKQQGPFKSIDDLLRVQGIGEKMLLRLRERVTVGGSGP